MRTETEFFLQFLFTCLGESFYKVELVAVPSDSVFTDFRVLCSADAVKADLLITEFYFKSKHIIVLAIVLHRF